MLCNSINTIITKIKGEQFTLDSRIPLAYFIEMILSKSLMMIRGMLIFKKKYVFIGKNTVIKCKNMISFFAPLRIADNCIINALSEEGITFGKNVSIHDRTIIECTGNYANLGKGIKIGSNVGIGINCILGCAGGIEIGDDTIIGAFVTMHSENHNFTNLNIPIRLQGVSHRGIKIGSNCWIGARVTILDGALIGNGCIIAAGAVVIAGTYHDNSIIAGVPSKVIKSRV